MNDICQKCGLYSVLKKQDSMAFGWPAKDYDYPPEGVDILVVVSKTVEDQEEDLVMDPDLPATKMLIHYLELSGHSYDFLPTTLCMTYKGTDRQIKACNPLRTEVLLAYKPKLVVCLGTAAITAIIPGGGAITTLKSTVTAIDFQGTPLPVLVNYHPSNHFAEGRFQRDLGQEYAGLFSRIDRILSGQDLEKEHVVTYITEDIPAWQSLKTVVDHIRSAERGTCSDDIEYGVNSKRPGSRTMWFKDTPVICDAFSTYYSGNYQTLVVDTSRWKSEDWRSLVYQQGEIGREKLLSYWGSNYKSDMTKKMIEAGWFRKRPTAVTYQDMLNMLKSFFPYWDDSQVISWLLNQSKIGNGLKTLSYVHLGAKNWSKALYDKLKVLQQDNPEADFRDLDRMEVMVYCGKDAWRQVQLADEVCGKWVEMVREPYEMLKRITMDLMVTEWAGLPVNVDYYNGQEILLQEEISELQGWLDIHPYVSHMGWDHFNVKSPQKKDEMAKAMGFDQVIEKRTPTGMIKIDKYSIRKLISTSGPMGDFWKVVEDVRVLRDRSSKFFNLLLNGTSEDGLFHPDFKTVKSEKNTSTAGAESDGEATSGTETGRLGCTLHILPKDDEIILRGIHIPERTFSEGWLITADLKSIEPMVNGYLARCKALMEMFRFGKENPTSPRGDVYITAYAGIQKALGIDIEPEQVDSKQRSWTKPVWLGSSYDQSPYALSKVLGSTYQEAVTILHAMMHVAFPEILLRSDRIRKSVLRGEPQVTIFGRRRSFDLMVNYYERYPETIDSEQPFLLYELEEAMLAEDKRKGREAPFKDRFGRPYAILKTDGHTLRESTNFATQSPANDINLLAKLWMAENAHEEVPYLYHYLAVHDSVKFQAYTPEETLVEEYIPWIDKAMTTPSNFLPPPIMNALGWYDFNPLRVEISYGRNAAEMKVWTP